MKTLDEIVTGGASAKAAAATQAEAEAELVKAARAMKEVINGEAWKMYREFLLRRQQMNSIELLQPILEPHQVYLQEAKKGAIHALAYAVDLPLAIITAADEVVAARKGRTEEEIPDV